MKPSNYIPPEYTFYLKEEEHDTIKSVNTTEELKHSHDYIHRTHLLQIQTELLKAAHDFLYARRLVQLMPVVLSPITDPLNHMVTDATVTYNGQSLELTKSMIFHKQIALATSGAKGLFIFSPNVRLEPFERQITGRHLFEFSQLDIELRQASAFEFMSLMEDLLIYIIQHVKARCAIELEHFQARIPIPHKPFPRYASEEIIARYGNRFEQILSTKATQPFWIMDYKREFYDKEDSTRPGHFLNYDLFYPNGFNEALSGGERDYKYEILLRKIKDDGLKPEKFHYYLELAKKKQLVASAGGGLGLERLVRYLTHSPHIEQACLFPRIPGKKIQI